MHTEKFSANFEVVNVLCTESVSMTHACENIANNFVCIFYWFFIADWSSQKMQKK